MTEEARACRMRGKADLRIEPVTVGEPGPGQALVEVAFGGICGSDMHYLQDGGIGTIRVREPIILGHEASGRVLALGPGVAKPSPGTLVAINPSRPCGACDHCGAGLPMHCPDMRFNGSAIRFPHEQGLFRDRILVDADQCVPLPDGADLSQAACTEPLAVAIHAIRMAGDLAGKRVLVTGAGPIGCLCVAAAHRAGASEITVTDIEDLPLETARKMGATAGVNVAREAEALESLWAGNGQPDAAIECSASPSAIATAIACLRPRGTLVQCGVAGSTPVPLNALVAKEIRIQGTHRFHTEFREAAEAIAAGEINVGPVVTGRFPLDDAETAFRIAADRTRSVKVQIEFESAAAAAASSQ